MLFSCNTVLVLSLALICWLPLPTATQRNGDIRLSSGGTCRGDLQVYANDISFGMRFYDVCGRNFGDEEAAVVCRQLGCNPVGAERRGQGFLFGLILFIRQGYSCTGSESSLSSCRRVSADCDVGSSIEPGDEAAFVNIRCGDTPPSEPQNLMVRRRDTALSVSWTSPRDSGGQSVLDYRVGLIYEDSGTTVERVVASNVDRSEVGYVITDLQRNTDYTIKVEARNAGGHGPAATIRTSTLSSDSPQAIFDEPRVSAIRSTSVSVSWEFPGGTVNAYRVQYVSLRESSGFDSPNVMNNTVLGTQTSVRIDNLQPSTWYMLRVAAQNENGLSDFSPETTSITRSLDLPRMITTQPSVSISGTTATVSWVFPGGTVNVYIVQYVLSSEGFTSLSVRNTTSDGTQRSVRIDNLQPFSSYSLRVAVQNNDGTSGFSPVASFSTETNLPQRIRDKPRVTVTDTTASVSWVSPGGNIDSYIIQYVLFGDVLGFDSPDANNVTASGTRTSIFIRNLEQPSTYLLRIAVENELGLSAFSPVVEFSTQTQKSEQPGNSSTGFIVGISAAGIFIVVMVLAAVFLIRACCRRKNSNVGFSQPPTSAAWRRTQPIDMDYVYRFEPDSTVNTSGRPRAQPTMPTSTSCPVSTVFTKPPPPSYASVMADSNI